MTEQPGIPQPRIPQPRIPDVITHPPFIYAGGIIAGAILDWIVPLGDAAKWLGDSRTTAALVLAGLALGLAFWAFTYFHRAGTNVPTSRPVEALVTDGPYRISRNPIYVALTGAYLAVALWAASLWMVVILALVLIVMSKGVIDREEALLDRLFGNDYRAYKARVRRWL